MHPLTTVPPPGLCGDFDVFNKKLWKTVLAAGSIPKEDFESERQRILHRAPVPVFWLFGKTGSGKTSIIKFLTGAQSAEIGNGFAPQTFPSLGVTLKVFD